MSNEEPLHPMHGSMPFTALIGAEPVAASKDEVRATLAWDETRCTAGGAMHGGALMSLADSTAALCAFLNIPEGAATTTIESKTNFLRSVREGHVEAVSHPLHIGRTVIVVETELYDAAGLLVAKTTQTQAVLAPR
jgi:1,4-dihydroxy-2-naphthoyl-CoA hydrolase